jgi:di/tricarboxylate transporter
MGLDAWLTLAVVIAMVAALARDLLGPAPAVLGACVVLFVAGVTDVGEAFQGFSNPAPLTVAALYVLAKAVDVTGTLEPHVARLLGAGAAGNGQRPPASDRRRLSRLLPPVALCSGFLNNTPIVAMLAPQVATWASQRGVRASRLLMPLSFAAILGGLLTTIGTSTTVVVSGLLEAAGEQPLGFFEISRVGVPVAVAGIALMVIVSDRLLPRRSGAVDLASERRVREFSVDLVVVPDGPLDGTTVTEAGLRDLQGVYLAQVDRSGHATAPVGPGDLLRGGDVLSFVGKVDLVVDLQRKRGLTSTEERHLGGLDGHRQTFFEAVVGADSPLVGHTLKQAGFRDRYSGVVVAIHRAGERVDAKLGHVPLRPGDTLLVLAQGGFVDRCRDSADFLLVAPLGGSAPTLTRKAPLVAVVTLALIGLAGSGLVSILQAALLAVLSLIVLRVLTAAQARAAVDLHVVVTIAAAFGVGAAISASGLGAALGRLIVAGAAPLGALGVLAAVMLATLALTELITNNAAAVLMFPIANAAAGAAGANARPFAIAVALMASASFLTPIGYQTNTMVYGLGGYRFADFARFGLPLTLTVFVVGWLMIPLAWPL